MAKYPCPILFGFCSATGVWIKTLPGWPGTATFCVPRCALKQGPEWRYGLPGMNLIRYQVYKHDSQKFARFRPTTTPTSWCCGSRILRWTHPLHKKLRQAQLHRGICKIVSLGHSPLQHCFEIHPTIGLHLEVEIGYVVFPSEGCLTESRIGEKAGESQYGPNATWGLLAASR